MLGLVDVDAARAAEAEVDCFDGGADGVLAAWEGGVGCCDGGGGFPLWGEGVLAGW